MKHAAAVAPRRRTGQVEARGEQAVAVHVGYPVHHLAGQIHDMDVRLVAPEIGQEERARVARRVLADEERVGGEGAPGAADGAEAAELPGGQPQQDVEQQVRGQLTGFGGGGPPPAAGSAGSSAPCARGSTPALEAAAPPAPGSTGSSVVVSCPPPTGRCAG